MIPEIQAILGDEVEIIEAGALDDLTREQIAEIAPKSGDYVLVTRLRDGTSVQVAEHHILPLMQGHIDRVIEKGVEVVALVCTGEFPAFKTARLLLEPQKILYHFVAGVARGRRVGVIIPVPAQIEEAIKRWKTVGGSALEVVAASPYQGISELEEASTRLKGWEADLVVLDCMGFTTAMKARAAELTGVPVVLPRTVLARTMSELL
ncbi:MAG: AroM family protein [Actinobacteria bacterium]|nr:AroM family protein [Actinomycetota bacterium]